MSDPPDADLPEANIVSLTDSQPGVPGVSWFETEPDSITWHKIWDHELESMTNISRPVVLGLSTMFVGGFLGLLPTVADVFGKASNGGSLRIGDLVMLLVAGGCGAFGLAFGFFAVRGQIDARRLKGEIRARNPKQIGHGPGGGIHGVTA